MYCGWAGLVPLTFESRPIDLRGLDLSKEACVTRQRLVVGDGLPENRRTHTNVYGGLNGSHFRSCQGHAQYNTTIAPTL